LKEKYIIILFGPAVMIYLGLYVIGNVAITFVLFYGWLLVLPAAKFIGNKSSITNWKQKFTMKSLLYGLTSGLLCMMLIYISFTLLLDSIFELSSLQQLLLEWGFSGSNVIWLILVLILVNPLLEELYWRDYVHNLLKNKIGVPRTIITTSIFYSLYHFLSLIPMLNFPFSIIAVVPVFFAGIIWGYFRVKLNSIISPVISHVLADTGIMLVYLVHINI
jgi:membrane protease YdiL (CAAX protease family)